MNESDDDKRLQGMRAAFAADPAKLEQLREVGEQFVENADRARRTEEAELKLSLALADLAGQTAELKAFQVKLDELETKLRAANRRLGTGDMERLKNNEKWSAGLRVQYEFSAYLATQLLMMQRIAHSVCFHPVNGDTCGVCGKHYWECDEDKVHLGDLDEPLEPACAGARARALLGAPPNKGLGSKADAKALAIGVLKHVCDRMVNGNLKDPKEVAETLLRPAIATLESTP